MKPFTPHPYQKRAIKWLTSKNCAALFLDPGLGKTACALEALLWLRTKGLARRALIVAPKRVCSEVWSHRGELGKWTQFAGFRAVFMHDDFDGRVASINAALRNGGRDCPDLFVINFDGLKWLCAPQTSPTTGKRLPPPIAALHTLGVDVLVLDELSKFKHHKTKRFKALEACTGLFSRRWGLTGSPAASGLLDLFGEIKILDRGQALGKYITHYRTEYFYPSGYGGYTYLPQPGAPERIYKAIAPLALSMRAADYLELPALIEQDVMVSIPDELRPQYAMLERKLIAEIEGNLITASNAAVASNKLRQFASGGIYTTPIEEDGTAGKRQVVHLHNAKTEALQEIVEELQGQPLLCAYDTDHDLERILDGFPLKPPPIINGGTKPKDQSQIIENWNGGKIPLLLVHPKSGSLGLNLQGCNCAHVAWYSLTWNYEEYDQMIRRVLRQGTKAERVICYRILARKTIDEVVAAVIRSREKDQGKLFQALKEYARGLRT